MTVLMITVLLLQGLTLAGVVKLLCLLPQDKGAPSEVKPKGTDFWQNIISYDHKKERRR
ncbi:MAG: hypothetical protein IJ323_06180 [Clostridia bacterium]|nr:hypothetical protein [Clostridia bacterium]